MESNLYNNKHLNTTFLSHKLNDMCTYKTKNMYSILCFTSSHLCQVATKFISCNIRMQQMQQMQKSSSLSIRSLSHTTVLHRFVLHRRGITFVKISRTLMSTKQPFFSTYHLRLKSPSSIILLQAISDALPQSITSAICSSATGSCTSVPPTTLPDAPQKNQRTTISITTERRREQDCDPENHCKGPLPSIQLTDRM